MARACHATQTKPVAGTYDAGEFGARVVLRMEYQGVGSQECTRFCQFCALLFRVLSALVGIPVLFMKSIDTCMVHNCLRRSAHGKDSASKAG